MTIWPRPQTRCDLLGRRDDEGEVRLEVRRQRGRHADEQRIGLRQASEVGGRAQQALIDELADAACRNVLEIAFAAVDGVRLGGVDVEAQDLEADLAGRHANGQADVAETDHAHERRLVLELFLQLAEGRHTCIHISPWFH